MPVSIFKGKTLRLSNFHALDFEPLGTKEKIWFFLQEEPQERYLLKLSRENTGEHWSEFIACKLAEKLGIPCAKYEILPCETEILEKKRMAVVVENLVQEGFRMIMGNEFLHTKFPDVYPMPEETTNERMSKHTIERIKSSLTDVNIKPEWNFPKQFGAFDVFCGYLLLDALISNQDRHHENWAVLYQESTQKYFLCESYDHAASLGRELTEEKRQTLLTSKDIGQQLKTFVRRARSEVFKNDTDKKPLLTTDALSLALSYQPSKTKDFWMNKLSSLTEDEIQDILNTINSDIMNNNIKDFTLRMIIENKNRILEC
ncbi:MAG: HipA domain-containing protein [[Pasteurella] aerogenes]|nr:HipA domain-containing protein [[Pasteurella] aerogenes]